VGGILGEEDIDEMLADQLMVDGAVEVTLGATKVTGLLDRAAVQFYDGEMPTMIAEGEAVHVKTGSLPGLEEENAPISVTEGTTTTHYTVLRLLPYGDGAMTRIALTKTE